MNERKVVAKLEETLRQYDELASYLHAQQRFFD